MSKFRKNGKWTDEQKEEIINYAKENGLWSVKKKYNIWPETVKYWMNTDHRNKIKKKQKEIADKVKSNPNKKKRDIEYRKYRKEQGITNKKWKEWYENLTTEQKQKLNSNIKQHRIDNLNHYKERSKQRYLEKKEAGDLRRRYNEDPLYRLKCNIREHIRQAIKYSNVSKDHPSIKYLGCSIEEFIHHIESQFCEGMTWDNHGRGERCWHLDHIKPLAQLKDINDEEILMEVCHYSNYQPLWEKDNLSKNDKYEE